MQVSNLVASSSCINLVNWLFQFTYDLKVTILDNFGGSVTKFLIIFRFIFSDTQNSLVLFTYYTTHYHVN